MEERLTHRGQKNSLFTHDGIHDSQTQLSAPSYFYKLLKQEIATSRRTGVTFSLIRLTFNKINQSDSGVESKIESVDVLKFSEALKDLTRKQDCVARLGINECVILVKESKSNVENLLTRLATSKELTVENTLQISATTVELEDGEKALALLNRLDLVLPHSD